MKALVRDRPVFWLIWLIVVVVGSCGQMTPPIKAPPKTHFVLIVHNVSTAPADFRVRWAIGGVYVGQSDVKAAAMGDVSVVMGESGPDLVELDSTALRTAWGPPDWDHHFQFHVVYPTGATWGEH